MESGLPWGFKFLYLQNLKFSVTGILFLLFLSSHLNWIGLYKTIPFLHFAPTSSCKKSHPSHPSMPSPIPNPPRKLQHLTFPFFSWHVPYPLFFSNEAHEHWIQFSITDLSFLPISAFQKHTEQNSTELEDCRGHNHAGSTLENMVPRR